jgi:hypothetical protein
LSDPAAGCFLRVRSSPIILQNKGDMRFLGRSQVKGAVFLLEQPLDALAQRLIIRRPFS